MLRGLRRPPLNHPSATAHNAPLSRSASNFTSPVLMSPRLPGGDERCEAIEPHNMHKCEPFLGGTCTNAAAKKRLSIGNFEDYPRKRDFSRNTLGCGGKETSRVAIVRRMFVRVRTTALQHSVLRA